MIKALKLQERDKAVGEPLVLVAPASRADPEAPVILAFPAARRRAAPPSWRQRFEAWCARVDLAPDLAEDIGSARWLRGMATLLGLSAAAIALLPGFGTVEAATTMPLDAAQADEFRSQSITPLELGADTGRHMGATPLVRPLADVPERASIQIVSTLGQGDTLGMMLARAGLGQGDITRVSALIGQAMPGDAIASGTQFDLTLGRRPAVGKPRALDSLDFRARLDLDLTIARHGGALALIRHPIAIDATPLRIRGAVGSSLYLSARNAGAPASAIQSYLQAIDKYLSLDSDVQPGDQFDMVLSYKRAAQGQRQVGDLLYAGLLHDGKPSLQLLRWGKDGAMFAASSFDQPSSFGMGGAVPMGMPVAGHISSPYGMRRHPILGYVRMHAGIDYAAPYGSPIYAVADGVVSFAGRHGGHGNYVRLEHAGGLGTGYGHMSRIAVGPGTRVRAGQVIGYVGSTGLSTGPHVHFEAYQGGHTINPAGLHIAAASALPHVDARQKDAFTARIRQLLEVQPGAALAPLGTPAPGPRASREIGRLAVARTG